MEVTESPASPEPAPMEEGEFRSANEPGSSKENEPNPDDNCRELQLLASLQIKYQAAEVASNAFFTLASQGDLQTIYRNRSTWSFQPTKSLVDPALEVWTLLPACRCAVLEFLGYLTHEATHTVFNRRENPPNHQTESDTVADAAKQLIAVVSKYVATTAGVHAISDVLLWACQIAAGLHQQNSGRPLLVGKNQEAILDVLLTCKPVEQLIRLLSLSIRQLLNRAPDVCMHKLFDASRYGAHFNWVWLHIARTFPATIVGHLLTTGVEQFKLYVDEINGKKKSNVVGATVTAIHVEYQTKFISLSDVFNFLMRRNSSEMQEMVTKMLKKSLHSGFTEKGCVDISFTFFFKLVVSSIETLRILLSQNIHLVSPYNLLRAIRQVSSVDQGIVLPTKSYPEFLMQVVEVLDSVSFGAVFESLVRILYDEPLVRQFSSNEKFIEDFRQVKDSATVILESMVGRLLRVAHAPGSKVIASDYPAIDAFAHNASLQFLINSAFVLNSTRSSLVIRQLHAVAISYGEVKSAEIVVRFLYSIDVHNLKYIYILISFITTTAKFQPTIMQVVYNEFRALKTLVESEYPTDKVCAQRCNMMTNLRILLDWEPQTAEPHALAHIGLNPDQHFGSFINCILSDVINDAAHHLEVSSDFSQATTVIRSFYRLMATCSLKQIHLEISQLHRLMSQLAFLLKTSLYGIKKGNQNGLTTFDELKASCMHFLYFREARPEHEPFLTLFTGHFVRFLFEDATSLFGDNKPEQQHNADPLNEALPVNETDLSQLETGPNVLASIRGLSLNAKSAIMASSGYLKRRGFARTVKDGPDREDQNQRAVVALDAIRIMCTVPPKSENDNNFRWDGKHKLRIGNCQRVANVVTSVLCPNAVLADFKFDDWDLEAEVYSRYLHVNDRIEDSHLADGLLRILSGTESFAYCLPVMKAQLVAIMIEIQGSADRCSRVNELTRTRLNRWLTLAFRGGIVHQRFTYIPDLESIVTPFETFIMLAELWKYLQRKGLSRETIDTYHKELMEGAIAEMPNEQEALEASTTVFRQLVHRHIIHAAPLFNKLFPTVYDAIKVPPLAD